MKVLIVLCIILGAGFLLMKSGYLSQCNDKVVNKTVNKIYYKLDTFPEGQTALREFERKVQNGTLKASQKETVIKANLEMAVRKNHSCEISTDLKNRMTSAYSVAKPGAVQCAEDKYTAQARQQYQTSKRQPEFPQFERQAYNEIIKQIVSPNAREIIAKKWQQSDFRQMVMIGIFDASLREQNNCQNPALPMANIVRDLF